MKILALLALVLTGCEHFPGGSTIGIQFQIGGKPPTQREAQKWREQYGPTLIGGKTVDRKDYPAVVRIFQGGASCTASVVGPRVILTAAHCGDDASTVKFQTISGKTFTAKLSQNPEYPGKDKDHALGLTSVDIDVKPVSVHTTRFEKKNLPVVMIGYGCTQPGGSGGNDGVLRIGESKVVGGQEFDLILEQPGGSALCYGDSGGPLFWKNENGVLIQIAVNSKGNIEDRSYCTRTTIPETSDWLKAWSVKNNAPICGITKDCGAGAEPPPPPPKNIKIGKGEIITIEGI